VSINQFVHEINVEHKAIPCSEVLQCVGWRIRGTREEFGDFIEETLESRWRDDLEKAG
jgi:hypothetical protein